MLHQRQTSALALSLGSSTLPFCQRKGHLLGRRPSGRLLYSRLSCPGYHGQSSRFPRFYHARRSHRGQRRQSHCLRQTRQGRFVCRSKRQPLSLHALASRFVQVQTRNSSHGFDLSHRRFGHVDLSKAKGLVNSGCGSSCDTCLRGIFKRVPFSETPPTVTVPLAQIHADLFGPTRATSLHERLLCAPTPGHCGGSPSSPSPKGSLASPMVAAFLSKERRPP